jgi:hypothetical protein
MQIDEIINSATKMQDELVNEINTQTQKVVDFLGIDVNAPNSSIEYSFNNAMIKALGHKVNNHKKYKEVDGIIYVVGHGIGFAHKRDVYSRFGNSKKTTTRHYWINGKYFRYLQPEHLDLIESPHKRAFVSDMLVFRDAYMKMMESVKHTNNKNYVNLNAIYIDNIVYTKKTIGASQFHIMGNKVDKKIDFIVSNMIKSSRINVHDTYTMSNATESYGACMEDYIQIQLCESTYAGPSALLTIYNNKVYLEARVDTKNNKPKFSDALTVLTTNWPEILKPHVGDIVFRYLNILKKANKTLEYITNKHGKLIFAAGNF